MVSAACNDTHKTQLLSAQKGILIPAGLGPAVLPLGQAAIKKPLKAAYLDILPAVSPDIKITYSFEYATTNVIVFHKRLFCNYSV